MENQLYHKTTSCSSPASMYPGKILAGETTVTTFDIRMTSPNGAVMNTAEVHTRSEHLGATFLRNHET